MRKDHYIGLFGKEPVAIRLLWDDAAEAACYPMLVKQEPRLLVQRRGKPKGEKEAPPFAEARLDKQTTLDQAMATALTGYLSAKIPADALQEVLGHAKPESLRVQAVKLDAAQANITEACVAVAYPPEQRQGQGRQVNLVL